MEPFENVQIVRDPVGDGVLRCKEICKRCKVYKFFNERIVEGVELWWTPFGFFLKAKGVELYKGEIMLSCVDCEFLMEHAMVDWAVNEEKDNV